MRLFCYYCAHSHILRKSYRYLFITDIIHVFKIEKNYKINISTASFYTGKSSICRLAFGILINIIDRDIVDKFTCCFFGTFPLIANNYNDFNWIKKG